MRKDRQTQTADRNKTRRDRARGERQATLTEMMLQGQEEMDGDRPWGIGVSRKHRRADFSMDQEHFHPFYELYYLVSGRCRIFVDHTIYHLEAGGLVLIEPQMLHRTSYGMTQDSERITVGFEPGLLAQMERQCGSGWRELLFGKPCRVIEPGRRRYVEGLLRQMLAEQKTEDCFSPMLNAQHLFELLAFLCRCGSEEEDPQLADVTEAAAREQAIQEAVDYIYHHFREPLTLERVAEQIHMSPAYVSRRFKKVTGFGYREYLNYVRLKEASRMLLETDLAVADIAQLCGFSDGNYFGDLFRKEKGMSPRMYRKNPQILPIRIHRELETEPVGPEPDPAGPGQDLTPS